MFGPAFSETEPLTHGMTRRLAPHPYKTVKVTVGLQLSGAIAIILIAGYRSRDDPTAALIGSSLGQSNSELRVLDVGVGSGMSITARAASST
jgi:hypothetical protein